MVNVLAALLFRAATAEDQRLAAPAAEHVLSRKWPGTKPKA
jgi:hypothetical protein